MKKTAIGGLFCHAVSSDRHLKRLPAQMMRVMRMLTILLFAAGLSAAASGTAQTVTLSGNNIPIKAIFAAIKKQTGYGVGYRPELFPGDKTMSIAVNQLPLEAFLDMVLQDVPIKYDIQGKTIFLSRKTTAETSDLRDIPTENTRTSINNNVNGKVFDEAGSPLSGVSIVVKKTKNGTSTASDGSFSIKAEVDDLLVISYVGYEKQEIKVSGSTILVKLKVSHSVLDETQITAYGKTTRRLATGNIVSITADEIARQPVMSVLDALVGRVPGMMVNRTSGNSASPASVTIRGRNTVNSTFNADPLYVIDGVPLTFLPTTLAAELNPVSSGAVQAGQSNTGGENPLFHLNPNDIERIDVLKDADATAIYGSRGANGVILITTKKAKVGEGFVSLKVDYAPTFNQRYPKLLNTDDYLAVRREAFRNDGIVPNQFNAPDLTIWDQNKFTDWQRKLIGVGNMTSVNLTTGGGTGQTAYRLSTGYQSTKEILNNNGKNSRINILASLTHSSKDNRFKLNWKNAIASTNVRAFAIGDLTSTPPNAPDIYTEDGMFNYVPYRGQTSSNFNFFVLEIPSTSKTNTGNGNIQLSYEWLNGIKLSTLGGYNLSINDIETLNPSTAQDPSFIGFYRNTVNYGKSLVKSYSVDPQISFIKRISKGQLSLQLIGSYQFTVSEVINVVAQNFSNDILMKSFNNASILTTTEATKEYAYVSGAGILNYNWDSKYIINYNIKRDGSSRFAPGKQFGTFSSLGASWIASREPWFEKILPNWASLIKFRGSVGTTGSDNIGDYKFLSQWSGSRALGSATKLYNYNGIEAFHVIEPLNQNFHWESVYKSELGFTLGFLNNRITMDVSAYRNKASNQLITIPSSSFTGFTQLMTNWQALIENKGVELTLIANIVRTKDVNLSINFTLSSNRDKLLDFPNIEKSSFNGNLRIGESMRTQYLLHYLGVDPITGNYSFEDYNKDGLISSPIVSTAFPMLSNDDRYIAINTNEKYFGNFRINFSYKNLSISSNLNFINRLTKDPYITSNIGEMVNIHLPKEIMNNHWRQPGDNAKYAKFTTVKNNILANILRSDALYVNGSYVRIQELSVRYRLPNTILRALRIKDASLSLQTSNLYTFTAFKGLDPEIPVATKSTPIPRTINTSFLVTF